MESFEKNGVVSELGMSSQLISAAIIQLKQKSKKIFLPWLR